MFGYLKHLRICRVTVLILFIIGIFVEVSCVKINQLVVPEIASPAALPVILDCDYALEFPRDEGLVVKWFFNERVYPVYQWIPDAKPQELGILKGRLDLTYRASEDRHKTHRALKIIKLDPELSGSFTCSVSTFSSEDSQTKQMLVFVPEKSLELKYPPFWYQVDETSKILCYAEGVYPKPDMKLFLNSSEIVNSTIRYQERNNGLFDVQVTAEARELMDGTELMCELQVPQANYTVRKEAIYYRDWNPMNSALGQRSSHSWILIISLKILFLFSILR